MSGGGGSSKIEPTPQEKEAARIADENWAKYRSRFVPIEDEFIDEVMRWGGPEDRRKLAGEALQRFRDQSEEATSFDGVSPNSGAGFGRSLGRGVASGLAGSAVVAEANNQAYDRHAAGVQRILGMGRNIQEKATANLSRQAASKAAADRHSAGIAAREEANRMRGYGELAGIGLGAVNLGRQQGWFSSTPTKTPVQNIAAPAGLRPGDWGA